MIKARNSIFPMHTALEIYLAFAAPLPGMAQGTKDPPNYPLHAEINLLDYRLMPSPVGKLLDFKFMPLTLKRTFPVR